MEVKQIVCYVLGSTKKQKEIVLNLYPRWGRKKICHIDNKISLPVFPPLVQMQSKCSEQLLL